MRPSALYRDRLKAFELPASKCHPGNRAARSVWGRHKLSAIPAAQQKPRFLLSDTLDFAQAPGLDLERMLRQRPEAIRKLFAELMEHFTAGHYRPLAFTQFAAEDFP